MAKFRKIIEAGPLVVETIYPAPNPRDTPEVRAGRKKLSSQAQQRMNLKYAWQKLELLIAANFGKRDLWVTLTYDDGHLPGTRAEAVKRIKAFFRRLRKYRGRRGQTLRYLYCTEGKHGDGRWHHHVLLNATGDDYRQLVTAWGAGQVDIRWIRIDKEKNFETLFAPPLPTRSVIARGPHGRRPGGGRTWRRDSCACSRPAGPHSGWGRGSGSQSSRSCPRASP